MCNIFGSVFREKAQTAQIHTDYRKSSLCSKDSRRKEGTVSSEEQGLAVGDEIVKINGKSPCEMSKEEQLALVNSPTPWRATIERNGSTIEVEITPEN